MLTPESFISTESEHTSLRSSELTSDLGRLREGPAAWRSEVEGAGEETVDEGEGRERDDGSMYEVLLEAIVVI
jgi:hypothetical protein